MKFKTIFLLFNAVIATSFLFIFLMPMLLLGPEYALAFWAKNWPLATIFLAILGALNGFFLSNWRIFSLVEREDWDGLSVWLSDRIYAKRRYRKLYVRFLVSTSLNRSDLAAVDRLEAELRQRKPALLRRYAVLFGVVYLLRNDPAASERFFAVYKDAADVDNVGWLWFDYAFSLILLKRTAEAVPYLRRAAARKDAVLVLLSAYFMATIGAAAVPEGERAELEAQATALRNGLRARFDAERWDRELERARGEIHIVILTKLLDDATAWLFDRPSAA